MHTNTALYDELSRTNQQIEQQIAAVKLRANEMGIASADLMDSTGAYLMTPLLLAKAQALAAMVALKVSKS